MNCAEFNELLFSYIEDELDDSRKKIFEEHMKNCVSCKKEYEAFKKMLADIHALEMEEPPKGYCKRLHEKLERAQNDKVRKKRYGFVKYIGIAASLVLIISAVYFTGNDFKNYDSNKSTSDSSSNQNYIFNTEKKEAGASPSEELAPEIANDSYKEEQDFVADTAGNKTELTQKSAYRNITENKIIKSGRLSVQTLDFDNFIEALNQVVRNSNGYFEYNETSVRYKTENKEYKDANIKLRVPQEAFYDVVDYIDNQSDIYNRYLNETDVTKEYYDTQNIVANLQIQETRLRELYDKAETITDILALENEIRRIRTEIDTYSINLSDIDDRVSMATIILNITEVEGKNINIPTSSSLWDKAKEGFIKTINGIISFAENIIIFTISYLPIFIPIAIAVFVIYKIVKKRINK